MRRIDGDKLQKSLENVLRIQRDLGANELELSMLQWAIDIVRNQPNIAPPPNDPLTLEELREMDGEPVWVERPGYGARWALVEVWAKSTNTIYLIQNNGSVLQPQVELDCGGKIYRRKPEEEQHGTPD